jgi:hypothetical protein
MSYVIRRTDQGGGYVSRPGSKSSYTPLLQRARTWPTRDAAEGHRCPENEVIESVTDAMREV